VAPTAEIPTSSGEEPHATFTETCHRRPSGGGGSSHDGRVQQQQRYLGRVTLSWWNNATAYPLKGVWVSAITAFHTAHLNVTIQNVPHQNEFFCHPDALTMINLRN
jgi:hypothetical protein